MNNLESKLIQIFLRIVFVVTILLLITFPFAIIPFWEGCIVFLGIMFIIQFFLSCIKDGILLIFDLFKFLFGSRK